MGVPYVPVRGLAGTDVFARRDDMMIAPDPFNPSERTVVARAINPDVALLHAMKADRWGNAMLKRGGDELLIAQASSKVIITAESIVDEVSGDDPTGQFISSLNVTAVVHAPFGAHPTGVPGYYEPSHAHIHEYISASQDDASFQRYLERYVLGITEAEYQARVGLPAAGK